MGKARSSDALIFGFDGLAFVLDFREKCLITSHKVRFALRQRFQLLGTSFQFDSVGKKSFVGNFQPVDLLSCILGKLYFVHTQCPCAPALFYYGTAVAPAAVACVFQEGDVIHTIRQNSAHFGHYRTAGNPGRHELDESQELYYPPIMQAIAATDYDGSVGQEFSPRNGADWAKSLEAAYRVCDV